MSLILSAMPITRLSQALVILGLVVLIVWAVSVLANPEKVSLRNSPGRANGVNAGHIMLVLGAYLVSGIAAVPIVKSLVPDDQASLFQSQPVATSEPIESQTQPETGEKKLLTPRQTQLMAIPTQLIWLIGGLLVAHATFAGGIGNGLGMSMRHWLFDSGRGLASALAALPIIGILHNFMIWLLEHINPELVRLHELLDALPSLPLSYRILGIISAVVLAPLAEEVFFRGLLQSALRRATGRPWLAILIASTMFSLIHAQMGVFQDLLPLLVLGAILGYNYERCGRLYPAILAHALFNAFGIWLTLYPNA